MSSSKSDREPDIDPPVDLLRRYEEMVATQIETINEIDEKAATTMRIVAILLGVILSGFTILVDTGVITDVESTPVAVGWFVIGLGTLLLSIGLAIFTYLSSRFEYGPGIEWGNVLANYRVEPDDYASTLLDGYTQALRQNRTVVRGNSRRFRNSLIALLHGMTATSTAFGLFLLPVPFQWSLAVSVAVIVALLVVTNYLVREEHLLIEN